MLTGPDPDELPPPMPDRQADPTFRSRLGRWWADRPLRTKILLVVAIPATSFAVAASSFFVYQDQERRAAAAVMGSVEVDAVIQAILVDAVNAESGVRGYLLTDDTDWLAPYDEAVRDLPLSVSRAIALVADQPSQARLAELVREDIDRRLAILARLRSAASAPGREVTPEVQTLLVEGKAIMDSIRTNLAAMKAAEASVLASRRASVEAIQSAGAVAGALSLVTALGGGLIAAGLLSSGVVGRTRRLEENARRLVRREPQLELPAGSDEIGQLAVTLAEVGELLAAREQALRLARDDLDELMAVSPIVVFRLTLPDSTTTYISANAERILGIAPDEVVGVPGWWREHIHPDDVESVPAIGGAVVARSDHELNAEWRFRTEDGSYRWVSSVVRPQYDDSGVPVAVVAFCSDITARRQAEEALRESERFLASVIDNLPDMVFVKEAAGLTFVQFNRAGSALLGIPSEALIGKGDRDFFPPDQADFFIAKDRAVLESGELLDIAEEPIDTAEHGQRILHTKKIPIVDANGRPSHLLGISEDITERKQVEAALVAARSEAQRANRAKSEFLSRMSHELRTPLNAVLGFAQLLDLEDLTRDQREQVAYIRRAGLHLLELINEVLDISRIETGQMTISPEPVQLSDLMSEVVALLAPLAGSRSIALHTDRVACERHVLADRQRLKQVTLNLVANAIKYNREGGSVTLDCLPAGDGRLRVRIVDTGYGIPAEQQPRLFTPFERLGAEATTVEGTGMGLALSKGLVEAMGGTIGVESAIDIGSTFWIELSLVDGPVEEDEPFRSARPAMAPETSDRGPRRILHIEDNASNLRLVERILGRRADVELIAAMDGGLGLELAREHQPDLVLLDLHLPDMSGRDVLRDLRRHPRTRQIPVVVVSADATQSQAERLTRDGAARYLTKPLDIRAFLETVDTILAPRSDGQ